MDDATLSRLDAAKRYFGRGFMPVPVPAGSKGALLRGWSKLRLTQDDLAATFKGDGNIALLLGEASGGLVDVDLDCPEARELAPEYLPPTEMVGGRPGNLRSHWFYVAPGGANMQLKDPRSDEMVVELRAERLITLVGPSVHPEDGDRYVVPEGEPAHVDADELAAAVEALYLAVLRRRHGADCVLPPRKNEATTFYTAPGGGGPTEPQTLRRASGYVAAMPGAISGQGGHGRTYAAATALVHGFGLTRGEALGVLHTDFNARCVPPWTEKELMHKVEDAATKPHSRPYLWLLEQPNPRGSTSKPSSSTGTGVADSFALTDLGNAERLIAKYGDRVRFDHDQNRWRVWDGRRWKLDDESTLIRFAGETMRALCEQSSREADFQTRHAQTKWAMRSESRQRLEAMVILARSLPGVTLPGDRFDADQMLLNVQNGTIDLRTGQLRPHDPADLITIVADVKYDAQAECPLFAEFVDTIMAGDPDRTAFLQRALGMCLTGDVREQVLFIWQGDGANGKSVLMDTVQMIMGGYATIAPRTLITATKMSEHPTEIADLRGKRLVIASETKDGDSLDLQRIKQLTGDATLKGRFMHQNYFEFARTHKTILVTNNRPRVDENSVAVWRRLRLLPFEVTIPAHRRNPRLLQELKRGWPGILAWIVRGCLQWQRAGLGTCAASEEATQEYRTEQDSVARFLAERCQVAGDPSTSTWATPFSELWHQYTTFCGGAGLDALGEKKFGKALTTAGLTTGVVRRTDRSVRVRVGVRWRTPQSGAGQADEDDVTLVTDVTAV